MIVIGIDYGVKRVAVAVLRHDDPLHAVDELVIKHRKGMDDDMANLDLMGQFVKDLVAYHRPDLTVVEKPLQGASGNILTGLRLAAVAGGLALAAM